MALIEWSGIASERNGVTLTQKTEYPWNGEITIAVEPKTTSEFSIMLRIPAWARGASVRRSSGQKSFEQAGLEPGKYFPLRRKWSAGRDG